VIVLIVSPVFIVGFAALAAADWRPIGATANGDKVSVSTISIPRKGPRTAWVRVEYKEPIKLPQGGPFVELRAHARINCASGSAIANTEWFYSRGRAGKPVVSKKAIRDDQFGQLPEGGFAGLVRDFVCKQK
jgi:hypothetical protein